MDENHPELVSCLAASGGRSLHKMRYDLLTGKKENPVGILIYKDPSKPHHNNFEDEILHDGPKQAQEIIKLTEDLLKEHWEKLRELQSETAEAEILIAELELIPASKKELIQAYKAALQS